VSRRSTTSNATISVRVLPEVSVQRAIPGAVWAAFAAALILACACGGAGPAPASPDRPIARVYRSRCGTCHVRVEPGERSRAQLEEAFVAHRRRLHLSEEDWTRMVDYLAARDAGPVREDRTARNADAPSSSPSSP
jgi:hypothetical protein